MKNNPDLLLYEFTLSAVTKGKYSDKDFGKEAIETILKFMEDNRNRISIIVAGYTNNMEKFINSNPGLKSRFGKNFTFSNYTTEELCKIFIVNAQMENYKIRDHAFKFMGYFINKHKNQSNGDSFGNGRFIRNIFEELKLIQSDRIVYFLKDETRDLKDSILEYFALDDIKMLFKKHGMVFPKKLHISTA